ncbi:MAG: hypothetical protein R3E87_09545 [Burkholderiaceae bacterium]
MNQRPTLDARAAQGSPRRGGRRLAALGSSIAMSVLAACGGGGSTATGSDPVAQSCAPGLITGFEKAVDSAPIAAVSGLDNAGIGGFGGDGGGGDGAIGIGIGGADGQYRNVDVTVETAAGAVFGPTRVDDTKGMVTFVGCNAELPIKVTFEGKAVDAVYYDEGLKRDVSFFNERRIGLISNYNKNVGVTPLSHALFDRAMELGRQAGNAEGWKVPELIALAHTDLLAVVNNQLPKQLRVSDLRTLPIALNATKDVTGSQALSDNENGVMGAVLAGLAKAGATNLPDSTKPALDLARTLIDDLTDAKLDLKDENSALLVQLNKLPYTYDTLWNQAAVNAGDTASKVGSGALQSDSAVVAYVSAADGGAETRYVVRSNGDLITVLNAGVNGGTLARPAAGVEFVEVMGFGAGQPVVALRRDGASVLVFTTPADGSVFFEVPSPAPGGTITELMDGGSPVIRTSDGSFWRLDPAATPPRFNDEPTPPGVHTFTFRPEYAGALTPSDGELGADPNGADDNGLCVGASIDGLVRLWRPVFAPGTSVAGQTVSVPNIVQVSSNQEVSLGINSDGELYHLDANHSVGDNSLALLRPQSDPVKVLSEPKACWIESPYVVGCDGSVRQVQYPLYTDGTSTRPGPISGLNQLAIPSPVWRTRSNRGADLVFLGTDGKVYQADGSELVLPQ